jgi:hypothetical protein
MSMSEALKAAGIRMPDAPGPDIELPPLRTPADDARELVALAGAGGAVEIASPTWVAVTKWAATQILEARATLEYDQPESRTAALRSRIATLRELLTIHREERTPKIAPEFDPIP